MAVYAVSGGAYLAFAVYGYRVAAGRFVLGWTFIAAIAAVLASGLRTADIKSEGMTAASTTQMGDAILKELQKLHA